jgi:hypothetical protein
MFYGGKIWKTGTAIWERIKVKNKRTKRKDKRKGTSIKVKY